MEDKEKNEIQDAEVDKISEDSLAYNKDSAKSKKNYRTEIILILIIGILVGIMVKAEALKKLSIGFSDYRVKGGAQEYDLEEIEKKLIEESKKQQEEAAQMKNSAPEDGGESQTAPGATN